MIMDAPALKDGSGKEVRRLHDTVQQHLRALKALGNEPSGPFITSMLELKLDTNTAFEWHKYSQDSEEVPHYSKLLEFLNLRAQASEAPNAESKRSHRNDAHSAKRPNNQGSGAQRFHFTSLTSNVTDHSCVVCKEKHPLYICSQFKSFSRDRKLSIVRSNNLCLNCLGSGHFAKSCRSLNRCQKCQKIHHTLLHQPQETTASSQLSMSSNPSTVQLSTTESVVAASNAATTRISSNVLLMTCRVFVIAPDGSTVKARALLDAGSTASFISERLAQALRLPQSQQPATIDGVAGLTHGSSVHSTGTFIISPTNSTRKEISVTAVILPRVTTNLPLKSVPLDPKWKHLSGIQLADPDFGTPGKIDLLLGVDIFISVLLNGRRLGPPGSPAALETEFGWVLVGGVGTGRSMTNRMISNHVSVLTGDDLLRKFWEMEDGPRQDPMMFTPQEKLVLEQFLSTHKRSEDGRFIVQLPRKPDAKALGESRAQAVRHFLSLERSLRSKGRFKIVDEVIQEYFELGHAELVPIADLNKPSSQVFYLPMHAVQKESSTTTKVRAVFDASAKSTTSVSLNDTLLVGRTVHSPLVDVLLRFLSTE